MPEHERSFWRRLEMLVMAAACGTLLGTGLLAGVISIGSADVGAVTSNAARSSAIFHDDYRGAYSARVVIDGVPLRMIIDTGTAKSHLSAQDAQRLPVSPLPHRSMTTLYVADRIEIAGWSLREVALEISPAAPDSIIGLDWLKQLGPVTLNPGPLAD